MIAQPPTWQRIGKIFDPTEHDLPAGCREYAQSPQALVCDDYVRVYFSTREREPGSGKFLSHVAFVDYDKDLARVIRVSDQPVIPLGERGCFDEHGIFPFNVLRVGNQVYAYTCGWSRRTSVSIETGIGLAISDDGGTTFHRYGRGPVLSSSLHEPCLVGDAFVKVIGGTFHMWYIFGRPWRLFPGRSEPDRIYKIAHATSTDGVNWTKDAGEQLIKDKIGDDECQALPTVVQSAGRFHMYFCFRCPDDFRANPDRGYRIGYAFSDDLIHWQRDDELVGLGSSSSNNEWDSHMACYPHAFRHQENLYLLYNGNEFGRYGFGMAVAML